MSAKPVIVKEAQKMTRNFAVLLRGINVGGNNVVPMADLKKLLENLGFEGVSTYIASGNVILASALPAAAIKTAIEAALDKRLKSKSEVVKVLVLSHQQLQAVIDYKPKGFGELPKKYHSDAIFLIDTGVKEAIQAFNPRDGVDSVWPGNGVIYSQRLSAERTKSRLSRIMTSPLYKSMTIRNWKTTLKVLELLENAGVKEVRRQ